MADTLKNLQKQYRNLLMYTLKKVQKLRRRLEKQQRERGIRIREPAEKANEGAARKLILARQQLQEDRASSLSASTPLFTAALESFRLSMLGQPGHKKNKRQRRQARERAGTERPRNQSPAVEQSLRNQNPVVEQMEEADREEGEGPPSDSFDQLCDQLSNQLTPQEQRIVRIVEVPEDVVSMPAVFTVEDDTLVIMLEDVDML